MDGSRILIVTYDYTPSLTPRALRWSAIAEHWAAQGHEVDVLAWREPGAAERERLRGVDVHRLSRSWLERIMRPFTWEGGLQRGKQPQTHVPAAASPATVLKALARKAVRGLHDCTWKAVRWPDYAAGWYLPAARCGRRLMRTRQYDVLITSSHPFTDHLVGLALKRACPGVPWVVDIGDPFCFLTETPPNNARLYGRLNRRVEGTVLRAAEGISVTNPATRRIYADLFPEAAERIQVIPPLARPEPRLNGSERVFPADGRARLVYFGRLYAGIRSPQRLLCTFGRLLETPAGEKLDLHFFGWTTGCESGFEPYRALMGRRLFLHGPVDHRTTRRAMAEADFLVNIGNTTSYQLPSKLVEYTQTGRPILNLAGSAEDSSAMFLRAYPSAFTLLPKEGQAEANQWADLLRFLEQPPRLRPSQLDEWLKTFQTENIAEDYASLVDAASIRLHGPTGGVPAPPHFATGLRQRSERFTRLQGS